MRSARRLIRGHFLAAALFTAALTAAVVLAHRSGALTGPEHLLYDLHFHWRGSRPVSDRIVLVLMDDPGAGERPGAPSSVRKPLARAVASLCNAGAAAVGIDLVLSSPGTQPETDRLLADAISDCGNVVLARVSASPAGEILPQPAFADAMIGDGFIDLPLDRDEVLRRIRYLSAEPVEDEGLALVPAFSLELVRVYRNVDFAFDFSPRTHLLMGAEDEERVRLPYPELLIDFAGDYTVFSRLRFADAAAGRLEPETVDGKIVLIGSIRALGKDFFTTPYTRFEDAAGEFRDRFGTLVEEVAGRQEPGVACHAHAVETLLHGSWIQKVSAGWQWGLFGAAALAGLAFYFPGVSLSWAGVVLAGALTGLGIFSHALFSGQRLWLEIVPAGLVLLGQFTAGAALQKVHERRKNALVTKILGKYVSPSVAAEILDTDLELSLAGQRRELSILFSDLRGFTSLSEQLGPQRTARLLNAYFGAMLPLVFEHQGTLDKLMGDAVMAFFGAPLPVEDHPGRAAAAALAMTDALEHLRQSPAPGAAGLALGIGLNTGEVTVGNLGSDQFMDYTIIGDAVNLASRLEGLNKVYGTRIIASEHTAKRLDDRFVLRELDRVRVKGKAGAAAIFELCGYADALDPRRTDALALFSDGLAAFRERNWDEARRLFSRAVSNCPEDGPSKLFLERTHHMLKSPPPEDWDGVAVFTTK